MKGEFYKMEYEAWDEGTDGLSLELEGAYLRLCHQMYRRQGSIPDQSNTLCRIWRCHPNKAAKILADLVAAGKVVRQDGMLSNGRVSGELKRRDEVAEKRASAGQKDGASRPGVGGVNPTQPVQPADNLSPCTAQKPANLLEMLDTEEAKNAYKKRRDKSRKKEKTLSGPKESSFPDGFEPNDTDIRVAAERGIRAGSELAGVIAHFRDFHASKGKQFIDWHAALRTWLRSPLLNHGRPVNGYQHSERKRIAI